jgi:hypothetical protein
MPSRHASFGGTRTDMKIGYEARRVPALFVMIAFRSFNVNAVCPAKPRNKP